jgi:hypothetical protein
MGSSGDRLLIGAAAVCYLYGHVEGSGRPVNATSAVR